VFALENRTGFPGLLLGAQEASGRFVVVVIVKATYVLDDHNRLVPARDQVPITTSDEYRGEPGASSLLQASDLALFKASTDIVLNGSAHAPAGTQVQRMQVELAVGPVRKQLLVSGDRVWTHQLGRLVPSETAWFTRMPLVYERAFGGRQAQDWEDRNPVGVGFRTSPPDSGAPLPNIEDPASPCAEWSDRPDPAGLGFLAADWTPRRQLAGTYDAHWQEHQFPLLPLDFDDRHFQSAPPDLRCSPHLEGDEQVGLAGVCPDGPLRFALPGNSIALAVQFRTGKPHRRLAALDTLTLWPEHRAVTIVWRHRIACPRKILDVEEVTAFNLKVSTLRRLSHAPA